MMKGLFRGISKPKNVRIGKNSAGFNKMGPGTYRYMELFHPYKWGNSGYFHTIPELPRTLQRIEDRREENVFHLLPGLGRRLYLEDHPI